MRINYECKKCHKEFDCEMGQIGVNEVTMRPDFERPMEEVLLTELGQSQMTEATMDL